MAPSLTNHFKEAVLKFLAKMWDGIRANRSRLVALVGIFIVFVTFIVRDDLREEAKDRSVILGAAEHQYMTRERLASLVQLVNDVQIGQLWILNNVADLKENGTAPYRPTTRRHNRTIFEPGSKIEDPIVLDLELRQEKLNKETETTKAFESLGRALESEEKQRIDYKSPRDVIIEFQLQLNSVVQNYRRIGHTPNRDSIIRQQLIALDHTQAATDAQMDEHLNVLFQRIDQERADSEQRYKRFTGISVYLYSVGWLLNLLGTVFGFSTVKGLGAE